MNAIQSLPQPVNILPAAQQNNLAQTDLQPADFLQKLNACFDQAVREDAALISGDVNVQGNAEIAEPDQSETEINPDLDTAMILAGLLTICQTQENIQNPESIGFAAHQNAVPTLMADQVKPAQPQPAAQSAVLTRSLPATVSAAAQLHAALGTGEPVNGDLTADPVQMSERQAEAVRGTAAPQDLKTVKSSASGKNLPEDFRTVISRSVENSQNHQTAEQLQLAAEETVPLVQKTAASAAGQTAEPVFAFPAGRETEGEDGFKINLVSPALTVATADQPIQAEAAASIDPARNSGPNGASLFSQVADSVEMAWQGDRQIMRIRLKPDAFGDVQIRLSRDKEGLTARISTDNTETHRLLTAQIGQLQDSLQEKGVNCRQIDIQLDAGTAGFRSDSGTARFQQPNDHQQEHPFDQEYAGRPSEPEHIQPVPEQTLSRTGRINYLA